MAGFEPRWLEQSAVLGQSMGLVPLVASEKPLGSAASLVRALARLAERGVDTRCCLIVAPAADGLDST